MDARVIKSREKYKGKVLKNNDGLVFEVVEYNGSEDVTIKFKKSGTVVKTTLNSFSKGSVKDRNSPKVFGIGFIGYGVFNASDHKKCYSVWTDMLRRCYRKGKKFSSYSDVSVCDEWHSFQVFAGWCYKTEGFNLVDEAGVFFSLDKDLFGDKEYSPHLCCFLPMKLNNAVKCLGRNATPNVREVNGRYTPRYYVDSKEVRIKSFANKKEAEQAWTSFIVDKAETLILQYEDVLSERVILRFKELLGEMS